MFSDRLLTLFLNASVVVCSFAENYALPVLLIKLLLVTSKYCSLFIGTKPPVNDASVPRVSHHKYTLELRTNEGVLRSKCQLEKDISCGRRSQVSVVVAKWEDYKRCQLSYCGQDCNKIPPALGNMYGDKVQCLDLSYNNIESLKGLEVFSQLEELVLDNNKLTDNIAFPYMPRLKTLSLNNNQITELEPLLDKIGSHLPSLTYLSLLSNKACPDRLSDLSNDDSDYQRYRYYVLHKLEKLKFLDSRRVSSTERSEARTRGQFMRVHRPPPPPAHVLHPEPAVKQRVMPVNVGALGNHKGAYGRCNYKYTGNHSEGNRFIVNSDL